MDSQFKKINFQASHQRRKKSPLKRYKIVLFVATLIIGLTFLWSLLNSTSSVVNYGFPKVFEANPIKSTDGRVNILLLGNGGGKHEGPDLTDSIIVASYHLKSNRVTLLSIPRDVWVDSTKSKINAVYEIGNLSKNGGDGLKFAEDKIAAIVGLPIHYGIRVDFEGFAKAIDLVGGVEVDVPKTFDDYNYPITGKEEDLCGYQEKEVELNEDQLKELNLAPDQTVLKPLQSPLPSIDPKVARKYQALVDPGGKIATESANFDCRFEHIRFEKGQRQMDGTLALKYVRSRKGNNGEGSDFARGRRQQLVLQSFRQKALSLQTLVNPQKVFSLINTFGKSFETDIPKDKFLDFYNLSKKVEQTQSLVLGDMGEGRTLLITPPPSDYGGAFVLTAPNNDFTIVQKFLKNELAKQATASAQTKK